MRKVVFKKIVFYLRFVNSPTVYFLAFLSFLFSLPYLSPAFATVDPLSVPNNKFGIHIIQATPDESSPAASLVNSSGGDWGYITFLIESKDRDENKWKEFFNDLRRRHLIPIVRLATKPLNAHWERPYEGEEQAWADFLDKLNWPTKNRYVIVYNEPNHAKEWGNKVDAKSYAKVLDQTITALKNKNRDFFVLNAGLDASAPQKLPEYQDQLSFMREMEEVVPGIFNKLDGWASHSYPNPEFAGSPYAVGRGTIRTWIWEIQVLRSLGLTKDLPIFITETGWKHSEGIQISPYLPSPETVAEYFKDAFNIAWSNPQIAAVTPFILSYQEYPFDHFSFKKLASKSSLDPKLPFHPQYYEVQNLPKIKGSPIQENMAERTLGEIYSTIVAGQTYNIDLTFKNTGQSIWNDSPNQPVRLVPIQGGKELGIEEVVLLRDTKVEPWKEAVFNIKLNAPLSGTFNIKLNLFSGDKQFDSKPLEFKTTVKHPVVLKIKSSLLWKKDAEGGYLLTVKGPTGEKTQSINLNSEGYSEESEAKHLLPDYVFEFELEKPYYLPKKLKQKVATGVNLLDFNTLQPDIFTNLLNPKQLWNLLPWSNRQ